MANLADNQQGEAMMEERESLINDAIGKALHFRAGVVSTCNDELCAAGFQTLTKEEEAEALEAAYLIAPLIGLTMEKL